MSVYERLVAYREAICELVDYNHPVLENPYTPYGDPWQLINVFDGDPETKVVCEGYSKAFQYLCDLSGITCYSVSGQMTGGTGAGPHMWNIVTIGGNNYLVDVTNCDEGSVGYPDELFLKGNASSGTATVYDDEGNNAQALKYQFNANNETITYTYDYDTVEFVKDEILNLSTSSYVAPTELTIGTVTIDTKTYNGTMDATVTGVTFGGLPSGVALTLGTDYTVTAAFESADAGTNKKVTGTVTLTNPAYTFASDGKFTTTGEITKATQDKPVAPTVTATTSDSITVNTVAEQRYIITTSAEKPATTDSGWVDGTDGTHAFTGLNPNTPYYIYTYVAGDTNHYDSDVSESAKYTTGKMALTEAMFAISGLEKTYNGAGQGATISSDTLTETDYTVTYAPFGGGTAGMDGNLPKDAGPYTVTITATSESTYTGSVQVTMNIQPATVEASVNNDVTVTKTYDGTTNAGTLRGAVTLTGQQSSDTVDVTVSVGAYDSADAGEKSVTLTLGLTGEDAHNYTLSSNKLTVTGKINPATPAIAWTSESQTANYTGSAANITAPTVTLVNGETFSGTINYEYCPQGTESWMTGLPADVGTYEVRASISESTNYNAASTTTNLSLTISAGALEQPVVTLSSSEPGTLTATWGDVPNATGYTVQLDDEEPVTPTVNSYTFAIASPRDFIVTVNAKGDGNYSGNSSRVTATFYRVTWNADGGTLQSDGTQYYLSGSKIVEPTDPKRLYYTFAGWVIADTEWDFENGTVTADMTLTANWTEAGAVTVEGVTFDDQPYGYAQPAAKTITIGETTGSVVADVDVSDRDKFIVAGSNGSWTIQPFSGLGVGLHEATIIVTYNDNREAVATVRFTVTQAKPVTPAAPTVVESKTTADSVTIETVAGQRYILTTSATAPEKTAEGWTEAATENGEHTFTGLDPYTMYYIYTYAVETGDYSASDVSPSATATTSKTALTQEMFTVSIGAFTAQEQDATIVTDLRASDYTVSYEAGTGLLGSSGKPNGVGTYKVTITATETGAYTGSVEYEVTIAPANVVITPVEASWTYGEAAPALTYTTNLTPGSALAAAFGEDSTVTLAHGGVYVGEYPITASELVTSGSFTATLDSAVKYATINPAAQTLTTTPIPEIGYGKGVNLRDYVSSSAPGASFTYSVIDGGGEFDGDTFSPIHSGANRLEVTAQPVDVNGDGTPEYSEAKATISFTVAEKEIDTTTVSVEVADITYGEAVNPIVTGVPEGALYVGFMYYGTMANGEHYSGEEVAPTAAGEYRLIVTYESAAKDKYYTDWTTFSIKPKTLTITGASAESKPYDGTTAASASVTLEGAVDGETLTLGTDYTVEAAFDSANAGEGKTVTITVTLHSPNYTFEGGAIGEAKTTATITKADATPEKPLLVVEGTSLSVSVSNVRYGYCYMILPKGATPPTAQSEGWQDVPAGGAISFAGLTGGEEYVVYTYIPETANTKASPVVASDPVRVTQAPPPAANVAGTTTVIAEPDLAGVLAVVPEEGATYQWYINRNDGRGYVALEGATQSTYTTSPVNAGNDGFTYYCMVTNASGTTQSAVITLRVAQMPQTGDGATPMLWALLTLACLGGLWALRRARKRNER